MNEKEVPYKCSCGGSLKKTKVEVGFFGIDFGLRDAEVCTACGSEYLDHQKGQHPRNYCWTAWLGLNTG